MAGDRSVKTADWLLIAFALLCLWGGNLLTDVINTREINKRLSCLEHPYAASSAAATRMTGRLVVTQPAHRTGCP